LSASLQDHFHLCPTASPGDATTSYQWKAYAQGLKPRATPDPTIIMNMRPAVSGKRHFHVLTDGVGDPIMYNDWVIQVKLPDALVDLDTWKGYLGTVMYYIPHTHDPASHNAYTTKVVVGQLGEFQASGTTYAVASLVARLLDDTR